MCRYILLTYLCFCSPYSLLFHRTPLPLTTIWNNFHFCTDVLVTVQIRCRFHVGVPNNCSIARCPSFAPLNFSQISSSQFVVSYVLIRFKIAVDYAERMRQCLAAWIFYNKYVPKLHFAVQITVAICVPISTFMLCKHICSYV